MSKIRVAVNGYAVIGRRAPIVFRQLAHCPGRNSLERRGRGVEDTRSSSFVVLTWLYLLRVGKPLCRLVV